MPKPKHVTWTRADRTLIAIVQLMECGDFHDLDPDGRAWQALSDAANAARRVRDQLPEPRDARSILR